MSGDRWSSTPWLDEAIEAQRRLNELDSQMLDARMAGMPKTKFSWWRRIWLRLFG